MADVLLSTGICAFCRKIGTVTIPESGYHLWNNGAYIQDAFPTLSLDEREQIISGTHGECFDRMFKEEE
jgi:hypothetical protein